MRQSLRRNDRQSSLCVSVDKNGMRRAVALQPASTLRSEHGLENVLANHGGMYQ